MPPPVKELALAHGVPVYQPVKMRDGTALAILKQLRPDVIKESFGYCCLTDQKQFYLDNYPQIVIENGTIDNVITMMIRGAAI